MSELNKPPRFKVGDVGWIAGHELPVRYEATVVFVFPNGEGLPNCHETHYVLEVSTHVDDYFTLRSEMSTWKSKDEPHNWWMSPNFLRQMKDYVRRSLANTQGTE